MKNNAPLTFLAMILVPILSAGIVSAQTDLNTVKIGHCLSSADIENSINAEQKRGLVIDARPFAINQLRGKRSFDGRTGRISIVDMNPFLYKYTISVAQEELISSAVSDFIDLLLPPALRPSGRALSSVPGPERATASTRKNLELIEERLNDFASNRCQEEPSAGCVALSTMYDEFRMIKVAFGSSFTTVTSGPPIELKNYYLDLVNLRNEQADASTICSSGEALNNKLRTFEPANYLATLSSVRHRISDVRSIAVDLSMLVKDYSEDDALNSYKVRCKGFDCASQFKAYSEAVIGVLDLYEKDVEALVQSGRQMEAMLKLTEEMRKREGLFARTFEVIKKFELSAVTVSVGREKIEPNQNEADGGRKAVAESRTPGTKNLNEQLSGSANEARNKVIGNESNDKKNDLPDNDEPGNVSTPADINESIQIGRPRFSLSGGLVYSPLARETFESVKGFVRDAQGNISGSGNANVVGFIENSPRRLLPMVFLNSRFITGDSASLFFSMGVTAKHDDNLDIEYLFGPSVSLLNDRALFTFGAYGGKVQNLVSDLKIGDQIPDSAGDAKLFTKRYSWKPGFSFSYVFSNTTKRSQEAGGGSGKAASASTANDLKDEIRIGSIPFNLAMGLAYTSLEDRTYDEVVGFGRDRQGALKNGETLTRIVGLTSSSNYRLVPVAMLHSRLINFGEHSFYFSTGVTGKKTDNNFDLEYLLGGSLNVYRRKLFLTFGAFAGKQQVLGGDFFLGAKLDRDQNVTTHSRYIWKPGFAFSYDISKILHSGSH